MSKTKQEIKKYILASVDNIEPVDSKEIQDKKRIKNFLVLHPNNFYDTSNFRGHITVSALVTNHDLALVFKNPNTNKWGTIKHHCQEEELPHETILRIIKEKTGIEEIKTKYMNEEHSPIPYYCDVYETDVTSDDPTDRNHTHLDLIYVFEVKSQNTNLKKEDMEWMPKKEASKQDKQIRKIVMKQMGRITI